LIIGVLESERCMISKLLSQFANEPLRVEIVPEPFGWDEIGILCSIIGTVATIIAVCVAIRANKQTAESLRYSLRMQEQSKNLNLYESRMRVLLNITFDSVSKERFYRILAEVDDSFKPLQDHRDPKKHNDCCHTGI